MPRRRCRPRRQGRRLRRSARRRRSRSSSPCRYDAGGRRRACVPRHHRDVRQARARSSTLARRTADDVFVPFTIGGGIRSVADAQAVLDAGADKVSVNSAALGRPELIDELASTFGAQCVVLAIDAKAPRRRLGGVRGRRAHGDRPRRGRLGARGIRARGRGDPADEHGPRRHQRRLRPRADGGRRGSRRRARDRLGRRRRARAPRRPRCRRAPTPSSARRSSTTAITRSPRSRTTSARRVSRSGRPSSAGGPGYAAGA